MAQGKVTKIIISYGEKRVFNFQSSECSMSIEIEVSEGDNVGEITRRYRESMKNQVTEITYNEAVRLAGERDEVESRARGHR